MIRHKMSALAAMVVVSACLYSSEPTVPTFLNRDGAASLAEMIAEPPAFIFGSSIDVWVYYDEKRAPREIAVTGHADSETCRKMSRLLFNTLLQKQTAPQDVLVAGAGWLVNDDKEETRKDLEGKPDVQAWLEAQEQHARAKILLSFAMRFGTEGTKTKTAIERARKELKEAEQRVASLSDKPVVAAYRRNAETTEALTLLVREANRIAAETGLVRVHSLDFDLVEKVRSRVRVAARAEKGVVLSFEDLLQEAKQKEAAVFLPMLLLGSAEEVRVSVAKETLGKADFEAARKMHRNDIETAMIGDARDRKRFYGEKLTANQETQRACASLSPEQRIEVIALNQTCTADGFCYEIDSGERMTRDVYCRTRVKLNERIVRDWLEKVDELIADIEEDISCKGDSRTEQLNHAVLIDSMLRDWDLPVARDQAAFDVWRTKRRKASWRRILVGAKKLGISPDAFGGENIIFSLKLTSDRIQVAPVQVVDLARSAIVVDPKVGATVVVDSWANRSLVQEPQGNQEDLNKEVRQLVDQALKKVADSTSTAGSDDLRRALARSPVHAIGRLNQRWAQLFPENEERYEAVAQRLVPLIAASDFLTAYKDFSSSPTSKDSDEAYFTEFKALLQSYPQAPPDLHLRFALELSSLIADLSNSSGAGEVGTTNVTEWTVLQYYMNSTDTSVSEAVAAWHEARGDDGIRDLLRGSDALEEFSVMSLIAILKGNSQAREALSEDRRFLNSRVLAMAILKADPASLIRDAVEAVRRDSEYWERAKAASSMPKEPSKRFSEMLEATEENLSYFELEVVRLRTAEQLLERRSQALEAAWGLWSNEEASLADIRSKLEAASDSGAVGSEAILLGAKEQVLSFIRSNRPLDSLARVNLGSRIKVGSDRLMYRAAHALGHIQGISSIPSHRRLESRLKYELGAYSEALDILFANRTSVALYHADIGWTPLPDDFKGQYNDVGFRVEGDKIVLSVDSQDVSKDVLGIHLPEEEVDAFHARLSRRPDNSGRSKALVSDQILVSSLELNPKASAIRRLMISEEVRLPLLKAMVYACAPPGADLVKISGRCATDPGRKERFDRVVADRVGQVMVPSLEEVKALARKRVALEE